MHFDVRQVGESPHLGAGSHWRFVSVDDQDGHVRSSGEVEKRFPAFDPIEPATHKTDGGMTRSGGSRDGEFRREPVCCEPRRIAIDVLARHFADNILADVEPIEQRPENGEIDGRANFGEPRPLAVHHCRQGASPRRRNKHEATDRAGVMDRMIECVGCGMTRRHDRMRRKDDLAQEPIEKGGHDVRRPVVFGPGAITEPRPIDGSHPKLRGQSREKRSHFRTGRYRAQSRQQYDRGSTVPLSHLHSIVRSIIAMRSSVPLELNGTHHLIAEKFPGWRWPSRRDRQRPRPSA